MNKPKIMALYLPLFMFRTEDKILSNKNSMKI